tara:strand:- start:7969 stop:8283 length:315 start_codon:yes stop_codon:yes gene_type:complete
MGFVEAATATGKVLGAVLATGGTVALLNGGWEVLHIDYQTKQDAKIDSIVSQLRYHEIRIEEYEAVVESKRDNTWAMRSAAHKERFKMYCEDLDELQVKERMCE